MFSKPCTSTPGGTKRRAVALPAPGPSAEPAKAPRLTAEMEEEVQCPICLEVPLGAILQCVNGHTVCQTCQEKTGRDICGQCQDQMKLPDGRWMRNRALEKLLDKMSIPCHYENKGCTAVLPRGELRQHLEKCDQSGNVIQICHHWKGKKDCDYKMNCTKPQEAIRHLWEYHLAFEYKKGQKFAIVPERLDNLKSVTLLSEEEETPRRYYLLITTADFQANSLNFLALSLNGQQEGGRALRITFHQQSNQAADMSIEIPVSPFANAVGALNNPATAQVCLSLLMNHYKAEGGGVIMTLKVK